MFYDLAALNASGLGTPSYHISDESTIHDRVRSLALENARRNAEVLANSQGAELGPIWGIVFVPMHAHAGRFSTGVQREFAGTTSTTGVGMRQLPIPLEPEPVPYTATVGVVYRIEPGAASNP